MSSSLTAFQQQLITTTTREVVLYEPSDLILASDQLDVQILCFIISLLQSSTCFEQRRAHHQEVKLH
jgi:hypothetical protein